MTNENNAATLRQNPARGVTEGMEVAHIVASDESVWALIAKAEASGAVADEGDEGRFWTLTTEAFYALHAALSAEPAAQGEVVGWIDEYGNVFPLGAHSVNGKLSWQDAHKRNWRPLFTAPPAQPAERVPEAKTERDYEQDEDGRIDTYCQGHMDGWNHLRDLWLAATPAPADGKEGVR